MGLVPVLWLALRKERRVEWWWLAGVFGVSWLADTAAHWVNPWLVSAVYPVAQAGIVGAVFLSRREAALLVAVLVWVGVLSAGWGTVPDLLLRTVAWLAVVGIVWPLPLGSLRVALLLAFGLGWLCWVGYQFAPGWTSWGVYQGVRAVSLGWFCLAREQRPAVRIA